MDSSEVFKEMEEAVGKAVESLEKELSRLRTGRASAAILEPVKVNYYGVRTPLNQCAGISTPEPRLIVVRPWDRSTTSEIEKAIMAANLGLTPSSDGDIIRIPVPPLTEERRRDIIKMTKRSGEEHKVSIRNARRDSNELLKEMEKEGEISEDESKKTARKVQETTDRGIEKIDEIVAAKEKDILEG